MNSRRFLNTCYTFKRNIQFVIKSQFCTNRCNCQITKYKVRQSTKDERISVFGWSLLIVPVSAFSLGVWQVQRKKWKESLLADMKNSITSDPVDLPNTLEEIHKLEYKPVRVKGQFLHDKEMYLGPRSLLVEGDSSTKSSLISSNSNVSQGYLVVTPFKLAGRNETILVNRGWVPSKNRDQRSRKQGQVEGVVDLIGVVRLQENRPVFSIKNQEGSKTWLYRDLERMSEEAGTSPIFLDATTDVPVQHGPIPGQTRVTLRNEHLSYVITWFSLCGVTSFMWYKMIFKGL